MTEPTAITEMGKPKVMPETPKPGEQDIVERIYTAVLEQRLPPSTKLSESGLCESLGVGRMKVRRALLLLASQGIVDLHSNRGAFIACPSIDDSKDVFGARLTLEPNIAHQVARLAGKKDLAQLAALIKLEKRSRDKGDRSEAIRLSGEFHVQLAAASGNAVLKKMVRELVTRTSLIVGMFGTQGSASCPEHEHPEIVKALRAGEGDKAAELMRQHLKHIESGLDLSAGKSKQIDLNAILGGK